MNYFPQQTPALLNSNHFQGTRNFFLTLLKKHIPDLTVKNFVEIGATVGGNASTLFKNANYYNIDIEDSQKIPTVVADVTVGIPLKNIDLVYSCNCFEHITKPWLAAESIIKILRPGGVCFISTVFSWRYHPVPEDYWRFTPAALELLFDDLICLETNFNSGHRRNDDRGFWKNKADSVPIDELGGWRESWECYFLGVKPAGVPDAPSIALTTANTNSIQENIMLHPKYVLCSHHPKEHDKSPCASVFQLLIGPNRAFDLAGYISLLAPKELLMQQMETLDKSCTLLFNGYMSLLTENSQRLLEHAVLHDIPVTIYWHETAWNLRELSLKAKVNISHLTSMLQAMSVTNFVPTTQCMHAVATAFGFPFESFKVVFEIVAIEQFTAQPGKSYQGRGLRFAGAGLPNHRKGIDIFSYLAKKLQDIRKEHIFSWYAATAGNTEFAATPHFDSIRWEGHHTDFASQLENIDIFLLTSRDDPSPLVALEALACNKPVFAFASTGYVEVLPKEFIATDMEDMFQKISTFIEKNEYDTWKYRTLAEEYGVKGFCSKAFSPCSSPNINLPEAQGQYIESYAGEEDLSKKIAAFSAAKSKMIRTQLAFAANKKNEVYQETQIKSQAEWLKSSRNRIRKLLYADQKRSEKKVCVIGNAPEALEKQLGSIIDNFDIVIRINNFQTKGYEQYIGSKTDYIIISPACMPSEILNKFDRKKIFVFGANLRDDYETIKKRINATNGCKVDIPSSNILNPELYVDGLKSLLGLYTNQWPSTGIAAIQWARDKFKSKHPVSLHGFSLEYSSNGMIEHYFPHTTKSDNAHNFVLERKRIDFMQKNNEVVALD